MLLPKKVKFRKWHKMRANAKKQRVETRGVTVAFGSYGLKAMTHGFVNSNQIEASRKAMQRNLKKAGRIWIRVFPDRPYTAKAAEVGMGKGKGDLQGYHFEVFPGRILFEIDGVDEALARETLRKGSTKLPLTARVVART
jgi:large subunit ribosomal protein L16